MSELTTLKPTPRKTTEYKAAIDQLFGEIENLHVKMEHDQARIQRLKAETQRITAETAVIKAQLQARFDALEAMV